MATEEQDETMRQVGPHDTKLVGHGKESRFSSEAMRHESRIVSKDRDAQFTFGVLCRLCSRDWTARRKSKEAI